MENLQKPNERIDDLEFKGLKIIQNPEWFCFGIDSVILSDFAKGIKRGSKVIDLGTGTGIIAILLCGKTALSKIVGVDLQPDVCEMAKRSIALNSLENRFEVICENVVNLKNIYPKNSFDVVVTNPPYKKAGTGVKNENENKVISRHEVKGNLDEFIQASSYLLKDKGELYMVNRPERIADIMCAMRKNKIEPKILKFVCPNCESAPNLVLVKGVKAGGEFLKIEKNLYVYDKDGNYTDDMLKIHNKKEAK